MAVFFVSFFGAALSALGMGGGGILLIYLTVYLGLDQLKAQGINLIFFIPIAAAALIMHIKNRLVQWRIVWPCILLGLPGVFLGEKLAMLIGPGMLQKIFGGFLLMIGIKELFSKNT
ncbi:MAG: sulfite exporter TauE/SafE family protein [Oscillospiraceae bacterium]|nr:sulfite exporter TauE/SafE family protein [Oscillospiraceae bacterium]